MLTIYTGGPSRNCDRIARRDFLRVGGLALGGLTLADQLATQAQAGDFVRDKAVVLLYLSGGASHIETFDPKMTAPRGVRSLTGEVKTAIPGVTFGATFPQLAARAQRLAVVRSFAHSIGGHVQAHHHVLSGGTNPAGQAGMGFSMGSLYTRLRGANHPRTGLPTYCLLTEKEIDPQYNRELGRIKSGSGPGVLGASYAPFGHQSAAQKEEDDRRTARVQNTAAANMALNLPVQRFDDRMHLLGQLDAINRRIDADGSLEAADRYRQQAVRLVLGGAAKAFDFRQEDPKTIQRYDTRSMRVGFKKFRPSTLGQQLLVARRLCEAGCGFVTVHSAGWDMHADGNNPGILSGMEMLGRPVDKAVSAFLDDLDQRGLSDKVLLVITGDFGRTPKVNKRGGRDHWARLGTLAFAGGGLQTGQVIGQSAPGADVPASDPVTTSHLLGTLSRVLFDVGELRLAAGVPREIARSIETTEPIPGLL